MKNNEIKKIRFEVTYTLSIPFYYEDGEQDGYKESEEMHMEAESVSELAEKIDALEDIWSLEVSTHDASTYREISFIDWLEDIDYEHGDSYDSICQAITSAIRYNSRNFRGFAIVY